MHATFICLEIKYWFIFTFMQSKGKSKEERFYRFMELSFESRNLGYGVLLVMDKRALDLIKFGRWQWKPPSANPPPWGTYKNASNLHKTVKDLPYTYKSQSMLDLTENETCI